MNKKYNIVGIGNAIVDNICLVEEKFLAEHNLTKGGMFLIDETNAAKLSHLKHQKISSGGSVANSIATLAMLESKTALIGKVGKDKFGDIFFDDLKKIGCEFFCKHKEKSGSTAQSFVLITPDGERTMCTYLGLASKIADEIDENIIKDAEVLYLEGYLWDEPETIAALRQAIEIAVDNEVKIAFSLSDAFCVERHQSEFLEIAQHLDILFANETEMSVLVGSDFAANNYQKVKEVITHRHPKLVVAMTMGEKGAMIFRNDKSHHIATQKVEKVIDTTGAGDAFAAGFLYGIDNGLSLQEAAALGNLLAGGVIVQIGARLEKEKLLELVAS
ncbi:MAG: adenosine kinase [Pseudomonadota bacterium]